MSGNQKRRIAAGPQSLGKVLSRAKITSRGVARGNLQHIFSAVVGHDISQNSAPYGVYDRELVIAVRSREVEKQLLGHQNFLVRTLQERCNTGVIDSVRYVVRPSLYASATPASVESRRKKPVLLDQASQQLVREFSAQVEDEELRRMTEEWLEAAYEIMTPAMAGTTRKDELK